MAKHIGFMEVDKMKTSNNATESLRYVKHIILLVSVTFCILGCADEELYVPQIGDIYFQSLPPSPLVLAIEGSTHSAYSHCGILNKKNGEWVIHEAIGPVRVTKIEDWILQGEEGKYDVFRLREKYRSKIDAFLKATEPYMGRPYDIQYDFDDEKIYCSELVFKAFKKVFDEDLGEVVTLGELDWKPFEGLIRSIDQSLPLNREMITPRHLSEAHQLEQIYDSSRPKQTFQPSLAGGTE